MLQDVRFGLRMLRKNPGFTATAVVTLALGIGANTAIFSVVNGVLLRPLPYADPGRLTRVYESSRQFAGSRVAYANFLDLRRENHSFTDMAASAVDDFNFTGSGEPEHLSGEYVSASFFAVLGVRPLVGRDFLPQEDQSGGPPAVILSYGFWKRRFGAEPGVFGRTLTLNGRNCTVVGILPSDFRFREQADIYVPLRQWLTFQLDDRSLSILHVMGRLKPDVTPTAAQAEMTAIARRLAELYPKTNAGVGMALVPLQDDMVSRIRPTLLLLLGAVGFVLIIACTNFANLLLARSTARRREFAIRTALGAGRNRVIRQLLTESVLLAVAGGALGLLLAVWGTDLVLAALPDTLPHSQAIEIDSAVLLFTLAVSILTGILFGLAPAFQGSHVNLQESLKEGSRGAGGGRHRAEEIFVALEVGLAVILLAGAALMMQSIWRLWKVNPGFDTQNVLTTKLALSPSLMGQPAKFRTAYQQLLVRVRTIPGVQAAAITDRAPLSEGRYAFAFWIGKGSQPAQDQLFSTLNYFTSPDYLRVMGIPLLKGRFFTDRDNLASPPVVVIDDVMARRVFPGQDPLGKQISLNLLGPAQIVGVAGHVKEWGLDSDDTARIRNEVYFPVFQLSDKISPGTGLTLVVRTAPDPLSVVSAVRAQVAGPTEDQPIYRVRTMQQIISGSLAERQFTMLLLVIFASTAMILASVGIYGVMSYSVSRRTHELGVRMALGAARPDVLRLVVGQGTSLILAGIAMGLAGAVALTRFLSGLLYGVGPTDPLTFLAVSVLLAAVALLACYLPARRATKVDPVMALRWE